MPTDSARVSDVVVNDRATTLVLRGDLDLMQRDRLSTALDDARQVSKHLVVDLAHVGFLDWIGLSLILRAATLHRREGGSLVVTGATASMRRLVTLMGAEALLDTSRS